MLASHVSIENFQNLWEANASGELMAEDRVGGGTPEKSKLFVKFDTKAQESAPQVVTKKIVLIGEQNRDNASIQDLLLCTGGRFQNTTNNVARTGIRCVNYSDDGVGFIEVTSIPVKEMEDALRDPTKPSVTLDSLVAEADIIMMMFDCNKKDDVESMETKRSILQIWQQMRNYFDIQRTTLKEQIRYVIPLHYPNINLLTAYLMDRTGPDSTLIDRQITETCDLFYQLDSNIQFCPPTMNDMRVSLGYA